MSIEHVAVKWLQFNLLISIGMDYGNLDFEREKELDILYRGRNIGVRRISSLATGGRRRLV
jgi:hypothetical protein